MAYFWCFLFYVLPKLLRIKSIIIIVWHRLHQEIFCKICEPIGPPQVFSLILFRVQMVNPFSSGSLTCFGHWPVVSWIELQRHLLQSDWLPQLDSGRWNLQTFSQQQNQSEMFSYWRDCPAIFLGYFLAWFEVVGRGPNRWWFLFLFFGGTSGVFFKFTCLQ
jgi:hypothetical protein